MHSQSSRSCFGVLSTGQSQWPIPPILFSVHLKSTPTMMTTKITMNTVPQFVVSTHRPGFLLPVLRQVLLWLLLLLVCCPIGQAKVIRLESSTELQALLETGEIQGLIDVRRRDEWDKGHLPGAHLVESLASYSTIMSGSSTGPGPHDLQGCEFCTLAIYCSSGNRAASAILILQEHGFEGTLYNGLGVIDWVKAGYELVNSTEDDQAPPCTTDKAVQDQCRQTVASSEAASSPRRSIPSGQSWWWYLCLGTILPLLLLLDGSW